MAPASFGAEVVDGLEAVRTAAAEPHPARAMAATATPAESLHFRVTTCWPMSVMFLVLPFESSR